MHHTATGLHFKAFHLRRTRQKKWMLIPCGDVSKKLWWRELGILTVGSAVQDRHVSADTSQHTSDRATGIQFRSWSEAKLLNNELKRICEEVAIAYWKYYPGICLAGLNKVKKTSVRITIDLVKIRTKDLPNTSLENYHHSSLLGSPTESLLVILQYDCHCNRNPKS
jgi:hypothetical protein